MEDARNAAEGKRGFAGQLEVLAGPTGRMRRSDELKGRIVAESWEPGARVADVARRHDAARWQIYKWRQLAKRGDLPLPAAARRMPDFATVVVEEPPAPEPAAPSTAPPVIELVVGDVVIRAPEGAAAEHLARAIRAARLAAQ